MLHCIIKYVLLETKLLQMFKKTKYFDKSLITEMI